MAIRTYDPNLTLVERALRGMYPDKTLHGEVSRLSSKTELILLANQLIAITKSIKDKNEEVINYCRVSQISNDLLMDYFKPFVEHHLKTDYGLYGISIIVLDQNDITVAYKRVELPNGLVIYFNQFSNFFKYHISINLETLKHKYK